jgi:hypothetical protein
MSNERKLSRRGKGKEAQKSRQGVARQSCRARKQNAARRKLVLHVAKESQAVGETD